MSEAEKKYKHTRWVITKNRCKCKHCGDVIESKHVHDFVNCKCGKIFTDGGTEYIRRGYVHPTDIIDLSEGYDEEYWSTV